MTETHDWFRAAFVGTNGQHADSEPEPSTWEQVDLAAILDGTHTPPVPCVGTRTDGIGLLYPGLLHTAAAESEAGKTWLALSICTDEIAAGRNVVYIDFEAEPVSIVNRLLIMGCGRDRVRQRFHYLHPDQPLQGRHTPVLDDMLADLHPSLVVVDGITEAMTLHGWSLLDNADVATFTHRLPRRAANTGAAVLSLDHLAKGADTNRRYALGGVHKLNAVDVGLTLTSRNPFSIGSKGVSTVTVTKDRHSQLRQHALPSAEGHWLADLVVDASHGEELAEVNLYPPTGSEATGNRIRYDIVRLVWSKPAGIPSKTMLADTVTGKATTIRSQLDHLIADGIVSPRPPYTLVDGLPDWAADDD